MPVLHPFMTGARGTNHAPDWHIGDPEAGYLAPAKTLAMMAVDLLSDDAALARRIKGESKPPMSREEYLRQQKETFRQEVFDGAEE